MTCKKYNYIGLWDSLFSLTYNPKSLNEIVHKLERLSIHGNNPIKEYYSILLILCKRADLCVCKKNKLTERETSRYFTTGLKQWIKEEIASHNEIKTDDLINIIAQIKTVRKNKLNLIALKFQKVSTALCINRTLTTPESAELLKNWIIQKKSANNLRNKWTNRLNIFFWKN